MALPDSFLHVKTDQLTQYCGQRDDQAGARRDIKQVQPGPSGALKQLQARSKNGLHSTFAGLLIIKCIQLCDSSGQCTGLPLCPQAPLINEDRHRCRHIMGCLAQLFTALLELTPNTAIQARHSRGNYPG
ncbi:hypothetical protein D3C78_1079490 [compost metagenome]